MGGDTSPYTRHEGKLKQMFAEDPNGPDAVDFYRGRGLLTCHGKIEADNIAHPEATDIRYVSREFRTEVRLWFDYRLQTKGEWQPFWSEAQLCVYKPPASITWPIKAFVILRGAFVTPWLTDYVIPLVWGCTSTADAVWM